MPDTGRERVWIIGASYGIGAEVAKFFAARGAQVILSARSADRLEALAAGMSAAKVVPVDVGDRRSIEAAATRVAEDGPVDRVVHLAALYDPGKFGDLDPERAAQVVTVNLTGSFHIAQIAPRVLRPGGQLALCGSVAGYVGLPQGQIYSATKAGVINLAESLRAEWAGAFDVRLISPGFVETRLTAKNSFDMPALTTPKDAAEAIVSGLRGGRFEVHFPKRFTLMIKLLRALPYWASLPLTKRLTT